MTNRETTRKKNCVQIQCMFMQKWNEYRNEYYKYQYIEKIIFTLLLCLHLCMHVVPFEFLNIHFFPLIIQCLILISFYLCSLPPPSLFHQPPPPSPLMWFLQSSIYLFFSFKAETKIRVLSDLLSLLLGIGTHRNASLMLMQPSCRCKCVHTKTTNGQ